MSEESKRFAGMTAIVTGAGQGLGADFARALARDGASVLLADLVATDAVCDSIREAGGKAIGIRTDVTDAASVEAAVARAAREFGRLDILVNNAAISGELRLSPLGEISSAAWDRVMAVNARGVFEMMKAAAPAMRASGGGSIINLASGTAVKGSPGLLHYVASKGAVIAMTRAAARELGEFGIRVNCVAPGLTMSESIRANESWTEAARAANIASRALKREAEPADIVGAVLFLASRDSRFMTGQTLVVDGGSAMI